MSVENLLAARVSSNLKSSRWRSSRSAELLLTKGSGAEIETPYLVKKPHSDEAFYPSHLCSSGDELKVAFGCPGSVIQIFDSADLGKGKPLSILKDEIEPKDSSVKSISWRNDLLACGSNYRTSIWNVQEERLLSTINHEGTSDVSFNGHDEGSFVLATCASESSVKIWDLRELPYVADHPSAKRVLRDHHGRKFRKARWSPSEPYLATIHARDVWIWDMRLTERPCTIFSAPGSFNTADIDWSPKNSEKLISTNAAGVMHVWSSRSPRAPVASQYVHRSTLASYSKDGNAVLAFGEPGTTFRVLDASNLSRVYELPIHSSKVKAFDFVQRRKYNSSALAVLQDNSSVSAVEIPHKEIRKCKGDQDSPAFPFRDGIFKGSLQNNFAYSILEFPTVIRERERSSETSFGMHESTSDSSLVKMPLNSIVGGTAPKPASEGEGYFLESGRGPPRCAVSFSSQGARAIFSVQEGEISETLSSTNPTISNSPRLTYFLTGDEHLHISVEEGEDAREASKKLLSAYLDSSRTKRTVEVVRLSENLKHVFQNSMASAYEILRDTSEELTWKEAAAACRTNAEVADKHSEAEIASMWRLAAVAFQEKPDQCIFARMLLLEIAMQLDARENAGQHIKDAAAFFKCICAAVCKPAAEADPTDVSGQFQSKVVQEGLKIRKLLRRRRIIRN
uniref:Uncharacterized protein n=1 Tax=Rhodosorus marinus TaxID=101924 RepID=A0A7S3EDF6_9RHOD|mmetsp:Transcript_23988/g.94455  ORF Transcript_23988/g.94455 Transcript_23988/m.94455 type:complete len:680 (+) Transcript_23988:200-2239(+)|eukprot:CAMPEP_0113954072 /NCGR_PEP_ID=MMETSP0011_2-20120614/246_1 /TAXON_ID=101924 /ORGANISM="Rhodosorus marinus" /LENGTH=679 /DNA_ID=CAMNT_0000962953 /DNA_START=95 /DNA_END=2134 /DNA_ORIENTATION=- /assembly_acc=CAM_ASM_000156